MAKRIVKLLGAKGFTLIELLVVISVIVFISTFALTSFVNARKKSRDAKRMEDFKQIRTALEMYYDAYGNYPGNTDNGDAECWGNWDGGNAVNGENDFFIRALSNSGIMPETPRENTSIEDAFGTICTYRYAKVVNPCSCTGTYAVVYGACELADCPTGELPACFEGCWGECSGAKDPYDIGIFLKQ